MLAWKSSQIEPCVQHSLGESAERSVLVDGEERRERRDAELLDVVFEHAPYEQLPVARHVQDHLQRDGGEGES